MEIQLKNGRKIGDHHPVYILAEIGINHNGDVNIAKKLIDKASIIGIDGIKFQKRTISKLYRSPYLNMPYPNNNSFGKTYGEHKQFLELSDDELKALKEYTESRNLGFIVSGFDFDGFDFINYELDTIFHKLASPLITHLPLLIHVAGYGKPMVLSTGMHSFHEVANAVKVIRKINDQIIVLQCTSAYPTNNKDVNLMVIKRYKEELGVLAGYSSHDRGVVIPAASVIFGSCFIEKHFTIDRTMKGPDHIASVEPRGLELILGYTRSIEAAIGNSKKELDDVESEARKKYGYSCVAKGRIDKGECITMDKITFKLPGTGLNPSKLEKILDKKSRRVIDQDEEITTNDIE